MCANRPQEKEIDDFLAAQSSWIRKVLQGDYALTHEEQTQMTLDNFPGIFNEAEEQYLELLKRHPAKLKEYREREAARAAQDVLRSLPQLPVGAPRGMRPVTVNETQQLLALIAEYEKEHGTKRGAMDYATKKVYGSVVSQHKRMERGNKALRRYKKHLEKTVQKPPS